MYCRVCNVEIRQSNFCFHCGWMNGEVFLETETLKLNEDVDIIKTLKIINKYPAEVSVRINIEDSTGIVSFPKSFGKRDSNGVIISVDGEKSADIFLAFKLNGFKKVDTLSFKLCFESNDNSPELTSKEYFHRPFNKRQLRNWEQSVNIEILNSGRLEFDRQMLIFNDKRNEQVCHIKNYGRMSISLSEDNFKIPDGYSISLMSKTISDMEATIPITIITTGFKESKTSSMTINYTSGSKTESKEIILHYDKLIDNLPTNIWDKVIAIDFGTTKTAVACLDVSSLNSLEMLTKEVKMIPLGNNSFEIPSCIAYHERHGTEIGEYAKSIEGLSDSEYTENIKMQLVKDKIITSKGSILDTQKVIKDFLREIKRIILQRKIDFSDSELIFTLPVLDGIGGADYEKQKDVTISSAQMVGLGTNGSISVITEPEAAMYYFINSIKDSSDKWKNFTLKNEDNICVFDFGGGTLDICFGTYSLIDGRPTVNNIVTVGSYSDGEGNAINLGGNRFDILMALSVCEDNGISAKELRDDKNRIVSIDIEGSTDNEIKSFINETKMLKEKMSNEWDNMPEEGLAYSMDFGKDGVININKREFRKVINKDIDFAIEKMRNTMLSNNISNLKYIIMVGGTSLIHIIKERLSEEFSSGTKVFNAYDYSNFDADVNPNGVRQDSIFPVVRGAAIKYMTTISDIFPINVMLASTSNTDINIIFRKGESFREEFKKLNSSKIWGEWVISGSIDGGRYYKLGSFIITEIKNAPPQATIIAKVTKDRAIKVYYRLGNLKETEVNGFEIFI